MSYKSSNLYASKVFAEHPLALWAIDENVNFVSLIPESEKNITNTNWTPYNASYSVSFNAPSQNPIEDSPVSKIYRTSSSISYLQTLSSVIQYESLDVLKDSVCFNLNVNIPSATLVSSIVVGFLIDGTEYTKTYSSLSKDRWIKIEHTADVVEFEDIQLLFKVNYDPLAGSGEENSSIYVSGVSVGQWSEPFNSFDTGVQIEGQLPANIAELIGVSQSTVNFISLDQYGFNNGNSAYAVQYNNRLLIETTGLPMVYGSRNNISILAKDTSDPFEGVLNAGEYSTESFEEIVDGGSSSSSYTSTIDGGIYSTLEEQLYVPSLIFPGNGFLNKSGIYSNRTAEFWMKINNESTIPVKIFGPLGSNDGLYVGGEFITVKVGKYVKSYFVGQWYRPMLIHFGQTLSEIYLMINGEKVISIQIDSLDIETFLNSDQDFLGFFGHHKTNPFEIDVFSVFPYIITEQIAKRRFVYGQGVESQDSIMASLGGDLTYVDFKYSGYSSTISYPDRTPWTNGYSNNLKVTSNGLSLPDLPLPELIFTDTSNTLSQGEASLLWSDFEYNNFDIQDEAYPFISMSAVSNFENTDGTIYFSKINKNGYTTKSIYSILKTGVDVNSYQSILYISNSINTNYFEAKIDSGSLQYIYNNDIIKSVEVLPESEIIVGFSIDTIVENNPDTAQFFSNLDNVSLNFAGVSGATFTGKIFSLTLNNKFFTEKNANMFDTDGFAVVSENMYSYIGSYTLLPKISNTTVYLDVAASGYWEASVPMTYFGKYINMEDGTRQYDVDLIQFNIDVPDTFYSRDTDDSIQYHNNMSVKAYVTLQEKEEVGTIPYVNYTNDVFIGNSRVLDFDNQSGFNNTKFEISDATVIFPPKDGVDFNDYYITTHLMISSKGINTENLTVKTMSFSSASFDETELYRIGTPTGRSINPISKLNDEYVYKSKTPVSINHESSSYLYISGDSGVLTLPMESGSIVNGVSFPINENLRSDFKMVGLQMYMMFNEYDYFPEERVIGKFYNDVKEYLIYITPETGQKRAKIRLLDAENNQDVVGVKFFLNGKEVSNPIIRPFKWNSIIISLQDNSQFVDDPVEVEDNSLAFFREISPGNFEGFSGQLEMYYGFRVNNVSIFSDINEVKINLTITDAWEDIISGTWEITDQTWAEILNQNIIPVTILSVDGENIFNTYGGLSYIIGDDSDILNVDFDSVKILNDAEWNTFEYKPI